MGPKVLVSDFDGTLAHRDRVSPEVSRAWNDLSRAGWDLLLATGRIYASVRPHLADVPTAHPLILYDGARVIVPSTDEVLFERFLPAETAEEALRLGWSSGLEVQVFGDEEIIIRPGEGRSGEYFRRLSIPLRDDLVEPRVDSDVYRVIFYGDPAAVRGLAIRMEDALGAAATVTLAGDGFLDVLAPGVSKGAALEFLLRSGGRPRFLVCAGDHHNDRELLLLADLAAVPDDADDELKEIGHFIFPPAAEGGFVELARELLALDDLPPNRQAGNSGDPVGSGRETAGGRRKWPRTRTGKEI